MNPIHAQPTRGQVQRHIKREPAMDWVQYVPLRFKPCFTKQSTLGLWLDWVQFAPGLTPFSLD